MTGVEKDSGIFDAAMQLKSAQMERSYAMHARSREDAISQDRSMYCFFVLLWPDHLNLEQC